MTNVDEINDKQESAMSELRAKIQAKRELSQQIANEPSKFTPDPRVLVEVPEITVEVGEWGEFSYERFLEIQKRLDACYGNFIYWKDKVLKQDINSLQISDFEAFEESLKLLVQTVDLYVQESCRVRYP